MGEASDSTAPDNRRQHERIPASMSVDYTNGETFLFSYIQNISEMGIFIYSEAPLPVGTDLRLRFAGESEDPFEVDGRVVWVNPMRPGGDNLNPGMGVQFQELTADQRERVVELVRTLMYL
jgi:type IV pilus assembly protein PilZ